MKRGPKLTLVLGESKKADSRISEEYEPGVYEEDIHPPGEHWYTILMPSGNVGTVRFPDELWDADTCAHLWKLFDRKTPRPRLR